MPPESLFKSFRKQRSSRSGIRTLLTDADLGIARGELLETSGALSRLIGRPTTPLPAVIEKAIRDNFNLPDRS